MNKMTYAGAALLAVAAVTVPVLAWSAADDQPTPPAGMDRPGPGMMQPHGWGPPGMMPWMRGARERSPQQECLEHVARHAGFVAYVGSKLNLTAEQKPLWDKLQAVVQPALDNRRQLCTTLKSAADRAQETLLDRMQQREQMLAAKLQAVQQTEPALRALYEVLTPEQKAVLDHPHRQG